MAKKVRLDDYTVFNPETGEIEFSPKGSENEKEGSKFGVWDIVMIATISGVGLLLFYLII